MEGARGLLVCYRSSEKSQVQTLGLAMVKSVGYLPMAKPDTINDLGIRRDQVAQ